MRGTNIITINGRKYDAATGMPVSSNSTAASSTPQAPAKPSKAIPHSRGNIISDVGPRPAKPKTAATKPAPQKKPDSAQPRHHATPIKTAAKSKSSATPAQKVHQRTQRSQTLHRSALKRPEPKHAKKTQVQRSDMIRRFAPTHDQPATPAKPAPTKQKAPSDIQSAKPRTVAKHHAAHAAKHQPKPRLQGKELKEQLINNRLNEAPHHNKNDTKDHKQHRASRTTSRKTRIASVFASMAALVLLGGYLTYLNLPSLSIRVAAARANVNANYPNYQPAGYSFTGPVAFSPGEVRVSFQSNTNDYNYTLIQRSSNWNSKAVLDNYVTKETRQYATLQERGLTIYLMENKAAWVNGGTFYVIDGNAPLSSEQIQKIASSTL